MTDPSSQAAAQAVGQGGHAAGADADPAVAGADAGVGSAAVEPLAGVRVVEVAFGTSAVGSGLAANLPGSLLRDLGAEVVRVRPARRSTLDTGLDAERIWHRGTAVVEVTDRAAETVVGLAAGADVLIVSGPEASVEDRGLGSAALARRYPRLVQVRIRPTVTALGPLPDLELLLAARTGLMSQIRGVRHPGPTFPILPVASAGAGLAATVGALAGLYEREATGVGSWAETSLIDGLAAVLPMIIGRVEHPSGPTRLLWENQGPGEGLAYRCADGGWVQLWFGQKGAYEAFLSAMGDAPSEQGYTADLVSGAMVERGRRWAATFATRDRAYWLDSLPAGGVRCEPVLRPGEALLDGHVRSTGLSGESSDPVLGQITTLGLVLRASVAGPVGQGPVAAGAPGPAASGRLLSDVRVLDLSAYLAGPVTTQVLAELGADVVKVEPRTGDVHRGMEPMFAAGQRGKRAVAVDLKAPGAADVLAGLFRWADVVHHNARVGLAERLGYDEGSVRAANPTAVYSHASGFGPTGPRALLPANDHLMQALAGVEAAQGGPDRPPVFLVWGAIDVTSGWVSACGVLAALYARRRSGVGRSVASSLLGAALLLTSGAYAASGVAVQGPVLDHDQTGYGAAYRIYRGADGGWFAVAVPDLPTWLRLTDVVPSAVLPAAPPPLRTVAGERQPAEVSLEAAFAAEPAAVWLSRLRAAAVPVEPVVETDRSGFVAAILDDPIGRQLGRTVGFGWGERGWTEQPAFPLRFGPEPRPAAPAAIPTLGADTDKVLTEAGLSPADLADTVGPA